MSPTKRLSESVPNLDWRNVRAAYGTPSCQACYKSFTMQESLLTLASCDFLPAAVMIMTDHYVSAPLHTHRDC